MIKVRVAADQPSILQHNFYSLKLSTRICGKPWSSSVLFYFFSFVLSLLNLDISLKTILSLLPFSLGRTPITSKLCIQTPSAGEQAEATEFDLGHISTLLCSCIRVNPRDFGLHCAHYHWETKTKEAVLLSQGKAC